MKCILTCFKFNICIICEWKWTYKLVDYLFIYIVINWSIFSSNFFFKMFTWPLNIEVEWSKSVYDNNISLLNNTHINHNFENSDKKNYINISLLNNFENSDKKFYNAPKIFLINVVAILSISLLNNTHINHNFENGDFRPTKLVINVHISILF